MENELINDFLLEAHRLLEIAIQEQQKHPLSYEKARMQVVQHNGLPNFDVDYAMKPSAPPKNE